MEASSGGAYLLRHEKHCMGRHCLLWAGGRGHVIIVPHACVYEQGRRQGRLGTWWGAHAVCFLQKATLENNLGKKKRNRGGRWSGGGNRQTELSFGGRHLCPLTWRKEKQHGISQGFSSSLLPSLVSLPSPSSPSIPPQHLPNHAICICIFPLSCS